MVDLHADIVHWLIRNQRFDAITTTKHSGKSRFEEFDAEDNAKNDENNQKGE